MRLEQIARTGIEPRIPNLQFRAILLTSGGAILIIRTPKSYRQPHRIIYQHKNRFWSRSSAGKFEPNVDELRVLFTYAPQLAEQVRHFRLQRITQIAAGDWPVGLIDSRCYILHVIPFSHFSSPGAALSMTDLVRNTRSFPPLGTTERGDWRINFDGFLTLSNSYQSADKQRSYVQVFRSGAIEAVASSISNERNLINIVDLGRMTVRHVYWYARTLRECGIQPPLTMMASFVGVDKLTMTTGKRSLCGEIERQTADRNQFHFTELILENTPASERECFDILQPMLDQLANTAGCISAQSLDWLPIDPTRAVH